MTPRRIAVLQAGGPTAVLNTSLHGLIGALDEDVLVHGVMGGPWGLVEGRIELVERAAVADAHRRAGALLGAGRHPIGEEELALALEHLTQHRIDALVVIGGNGSMTLAGRIEAAARASDRRLAVIGVPKTVDNDLVATDRAPGYASAARFVAHAVRDLGADQLAMGGLEDVRLVETIGRDVGWVAMAAHAMRPDDGPRNLIFVPESGQQADEVVGRIVQAREADGPVLAVVAEGVAGELTGGMFQRTVHDRPLLGGVTRILADRLGEQAGYRVRAEVLGMIQRSATIAVSAADRADALAVGAAAADALRAGRSGEMITLLASPGVAGVTGSVVLGEVAGRSRPVPDAWLGTDVSTCADEFLQWLLPLIRGEQPHEGCEDAEVPGSTAPGSRGER